MGAGIGAGWLDDRLDEPPLPNACGARSPKALSMQASCDASIWTTAIDVQRSRGLVGIVAGLS
jgi:hypothetical protein